MKTSPLFDELNRPALATAKALWFALTFSIAVYVGLAFLVFPRQAAPGLAMETPHWAIYFYGAAAVLAGLSVALGKNRFSSSRLAKRLEIEMCPRELSIDPRTRKVDMQRLKKIGELTKDELRLLGLERWHFPPFIAALAISEAIAILGVVLSFLAHRGAPVIPFAAAGIVLNLTWYGKLDRLIEQGKALLGQG